VSSLRHDLRGIITSGALIADYMQGHSDPGVQRCAKRIAGMIASAWIKPMTSFRDVVAPG
jgi:hypothetical protein